MRLQDFTDRMKKQRESMLSQFEREKQANPPPNCQKDLLERENTIARYEKRITELEKLLSETVTNISRHDTVSVQGSET